MALTVRYFTLALSTLALYYWRFFVGIEIKQIKSMGWDYLSDYWNWIDGTQLILNFTFLVMLNIDVLTGYLVFSTPLIRTIGAIGCFLCWFKVFYFMRIFRSTASFVTLIF